MTQSHVGTNMIFLPKNAARSKIIKLTRERRRSIAGLHRASFLEFKLQVGDV